MPTHIEASHPTYAEIVKPNHDASQQQQLGKYTNGDAEEMVVRSIRSVPVTEERKPYINNDPNTGLQHAGKHTARQPSTTPN
jgi:hypothetical protein